MRVLLRNTKTGQYLDKNGGWVEHKVLAMEFTHSAKALEYCSVHKFKEVEILLSFDDARWDIHVPGVTDSRRPTPPTT